MVNFAITKKNTPMLKEFKEFISRGNVIDLAVAVIIGAAFKQIISSLVDDIIMPVLGTIIGKSLSYLEITINGASVKIGMFMQNILDFLIVAFVIFLMVKLINKAKKKKEAEEPAAPPAPTKDQELLSEIRDLLKK